MILIALIYMAMTYASVWSLKNLDLEGFKTLVAVMPMVPIVFMVIIILRYVRNLDELQQKIQLEACVFSMITTGLVTGTYGFLENADYPPMEIIWVMPMLIITWSLGGAIARKRYS